MPPRHYVLAESNYRQLLQRRPKVAVLPWGATEAHNYHLPHGTDTLQAEALAHASAARADADGAEVVVLPAIPFGNDEQQLDQVATISISTTTAAALLDDVVRSLTTQGIDRLLILNAHGGNEHKPIVRDVQARRKALIVVVNFWQLRPDATIRIFDDPGDHGGELETSLIMHLRPDLVEFDHAGDGARVGPPIEHLSQPGVWTPRPWSKVHPDTGAGDPRAATPEKGRQYFAELVEAISQLLGSLARVERGSSAYY